MSVGEKYLIISIMHRTILQRTESMAFDMPVINCFGKRAITCERQLQVVGKRAGAMRVCTGLCASRAQKWFITT